MTIKDYVYLGLIALAALVFYCHGFYAGVSRSRRVYEALIEEEPFTDAPATESKAAPVTFIASREISPPFLRRAARPDFGEN